MVCMPVRMTCSIHAVQSCVPHKLNDVEIVVRSVRVVPTPDTISCVLHHNIMCGSGCAGNTSVARVEGGGGGAPGK